MGLPVGRITAVLRTCWVYITIIMRRKIIFRRLLRHYMRNLLVRIGTGFLLGERCGALLPRPTVKDAQTQEIRLIRGFDTAYRRMEWDKPAPTLTQKIHTIASDKKVHPSQNRTLSFFLSFFPVSALSSGSPPMAFRSVTQGFFNRPPVSVCVMAGRKEPFF